MKLNIHHWIILALIVGFIALTLGWQYLPEGIQPYFHGRIAIITSFLVILCALGLLRYGGPIVADVMNDIDNTDE